MYEEHDGYEDARRLLAPLASEPTRPSMVDISRAVADGRRRLRHRRVAAVSGIAAVTALVAAGVPAALAAVRAPEGPPVASTAAPTATPSPSPVPFPVPTASPEPAPEPPTRCELELPPVPAGASPSFAFGTDPTGRIAFGKYYQLGTDAASIQPVLWIDDEAVPIDVPGDDPNIQAVNSSGVAVGTSLVGEEAGRHVAWIYQDGVVTELAGHDVEAQAITEDGIVLGTRADREIPVVWRSPGAPPEDLPIPGESLRMSGMMPDGTVVGFGVGGRSFVLWPDGTYQSIPSPTFDGERFEFRARALNGRLLVGEALLFQGEDTVGYAAAYDLSTEEYTNLSQDAPLMMWSVNRHGWVAGEADGYAGLWTPEGGLVQLPDLGVNHEYGPNLPHWVTDDGRTITGVVEVEERSRAAIWRCD